MTRALLLCLLLAGCAQMEWSKPGAQPKEVQADLDECRIMARHSVVQTRLPQVRPPADYVEASDPGRQGVRSELDFTNECMRRKGYELTPVN